MSESLATEPATVVEQVRAYLQQLEDLGEASTGSLAEYFGTPYGTIRNRLNRAGTGWCKEKRAERVRRFDAMMAGPGRVSCSRGAKVCGLSGAEAFQTFILREKGVNFSDLAYQRQREYTKWLM